MHAAARPFLFTLNLAISLLLLSSIAHAQQQPPREPRWDLGAWFAVATGEETTNSFTQTQAYTGGFFLGYTLTPNIGPSFLRGSFEYGANLGTFFVQSHPAPAYGGGFDPIVLRWNFAHRYHALQPFIELSGGGIFTNTNLPPGDTSSFNFAVRGGGGARIHTRSRQSLDVGLFFYHVSNANLGLDNPEFNGIQFNFGYHWYK
jgi:hypothetical protein